MKMSLLSILFFVSQLNSAVCFASSQFDPTASAHITATLDSERIKDHIPGITFAVFNKTGIIAKGQAGDSDLSHRDGSSPLDADTSISRIASVSKLFTSLALTHLFERGYVSSHSRFLDLRRTDVVQLLRENETAERLKNWRKIRVDQMMSHQAGLSKDISGSLLGFNSESLSTNSYPSFDVLYHNLTDTEFVYPAGQIDTNFKYSNLAVNLLARVVAAYNPLGYEFPAYVQHLLLKPLNMRSTFYNVPRREQRRMVIGYGALLPDGSRVEAPKATRAGSYEGSMGVATTAPDLARLGAGLLKIVYRESKILTQPNIIEDWLSIKSPADPNNGWANGPAWIVLPGESADSDIWLGHEGTGPSERAALVVNVERNLGVALLFNCSDANREKYIQLALKQLAVDHPELFAAKIPLNEMAATIVANAKDVLKNTPKPTAFTPPRYPDGLDLSGYVGRFYADLAGYQNVTVDSSGYLVLMGQRLAYEGNRGEGHFRMPPVGGGAATTINKEPVVFNLKDGKAESLNVFRIGIFRRADL